MKITTKRNIGSALIGFGCGTLATNVWQALFAGLCFLFAMYLFTDAL